MNLCLNLNVCLFQLLAASVSAKLYANFYLFSRKRTSSIFLPKSPALCKTSENILIFAKILVFAEICRFSQNFRENVKNVFSWKPYLHGGGIAPCDKPTGSQNCSRGDIQRGKLKTWRSGFLEKARDTLRSSLRLFKKTTSSIYSLNIASDIS